VTAVANRRTPRRPGLIPALPRLAWVVLGCDFASAVGGGLTLPCLFIYAHQVRHLSYAAAGLVVATVALASLAGNPAGGAAADRWSPRHALIGGLFIAAAGSVGLALAASPLALFGAAAVTGLGVSVAWPAQDALLASLAGPDGLSAVFSVRHAGLNAGLGLGALGAAAIVTVSHPGTFTAVYLADAATYLVIVPLLARLRVPAPPAGAGAEPAAEAGAPAPAPAAGGGFWPVLRDRTFVRVWLLTAFLATVSFGQFQAAYAGFATRPGGITTHLLSLSYAANTVTVVVAQLFVLRWLGGRQRTTATALAATAWALTWVIVLGAGRLGDGVTAAIGFAVAMIAFGLAETMFSPTLPAIINDIAPPGAAGRYNGLSVLAFTTGMLLGPVIGGAALGAGGGTWLFTGLVLACLAAAALALALGRHLPRAANQITSPSGAEPPD
jgi:MFS family permease